MVIILFGLEGLVQLLLALMVVPILVVAEVPVEQEEEVVEQEEVE